MTLKDSLLHLCGSYIQTKTVEVGPHRKGCVQNGSLNEYKNEPHEGLSDLWVFWNTLSFRPARRGARLREAGDSRHS